MNWQVFVTDPARRQLSKIYLQDAEKVESAIDGMANDPYIGDIQKLSGKNDVWRRRVGSYRIFYKPDFNQRIIYILEILRRTSKTY